MNNEKQLISRLKKGENQAVEEWFRLFYPKLMKTALAKLPNNETAEELVQETFINSLRQLPLFRGKSKLMTWMQSILRHEIADFYRKQYAKKAIRTLPLSEILLSHPIEDAHEVSIKVKQTLQKMTDEKRELLMLKYVDKKKVKEISAELGKTVKAVESDLFRARGEFRELYVALPD